MLRSNKLGVAYSSPILFAAFTLVLLTTWSWPWRWLLSGTPILQLLLHIGEARDRRVLRTIHLWPILSTLNLFYAVCSTSWLLYWVFTTLCYANIILVSLFQFNIASNVARKFLRRLLRQLHFIDDKIAFFNIPALEIDTDVDGLMVLRGITFSLSTLSFVVHGVEVGIKLSDDMELAIQTEEVRVKLFRSIEVGDCFANLKGGEQEMTFKKLEGNSKDADGDAVFIENTPLLKAAAKEGDRRSIAGSTDDLLSPDRMTGPKRPTMVKMTSRMTDGRPPEDGSARASYQSMKKLSLDNDAAGGKYRDILEYIQNTNAIQEARQFVKDAAELEDENDVRAAICSHIQQTPSVPHPPRLSVKVTTLQNLAPPKVRRFLHRLPFLLRLLLNPLSYFHPVKISSINASASGTWIQKMLVEQVFKDYAESSSELRSIKKRIAEWLRDANFIVELGAITGLAHVPLIPTYDITTELAVESVLAYRALPAGIDLQCQQVVSLGGADARFVVPSFLLPHHDHLLPPRPQAREEQFEVTVEEAGNKSKEIQAQRALEQVRNDEANVKISVHARLPAVLDQSLLDFIAALVKASKIAEFERLADEREEQEEEEMSASSEHEREKRSLREMSAAFKGRVKESMKRTLVDSMVSDRWIAKMVGRITKKLEGAMGEAGYSGDIPVKLEVYRTGESEREGEKLLP
ncbi:hypothetical protein N0V93_008229 [Gnomoniopsis smithogilvyi]|uniref:Uncharacterized protein n=1 Tax=Gnomoniopsis smithogilvyi TaxID=1191159 RepID=A0A9W9CUK3_9PEZI|nr:hypothetical protein N0V93_008229 [Gnomoniopsis smithogilvyi]